MSVMPVTVKKTDLFGKLTEAEACKTCGGDGLEEYDPPDIDMAPAYRDCTACCGTGHKDGCEATESPSGMTSAALVVMLDTFQTTVQEPLRRWIEQSKNVDPPPRGADIPAAFFALLNVEYEAKKLYFQIERMRRQVVQEEANDQIRGR